MATSRVSNLSQFRESFAVQNIVGRLPSWFPGHMYKGMKQMQKKLAIVDCIIEVHDARIPFSGRNPKFYSMLYAIKPHILVLNKMDLVDMSYKSSIVKKLNAQGVNSVLFTNLNGSKQNVTREVIPIALDLIEKSNRYNRAKSLELCTMILGIPNVGKSSLINRLRNETLKRKNATAVGAKPGITKSVLEKIKVSDSPVMYVLDTPGVMQPHVKDVEVGLRLALCCTLNDSVVGEEIIADYLLYWLNKHQNFSYVEYFGIKEPVDDIMTLLFQIAVIRNKTIQRRLPEGSCKTFPDTLYAAKYFIAAFRKGIFGKVFIDDDLMDTKF